MEFEVKEISFEDSAMGKQVKELRRIADAAQQQTVLAEKRAQGAEKEAEKAKREKVVASVFAVFSFLASVLMWLFTRDEFIDFVKKLF